MGAINFRFLFGIICFILVSCALLENGYTDEHGHYVPKKPSFTLKDKQSTPSSRIDTINIYKMVEMYNDNILIYPLPDTEKNSKHLYKELNSSCQYIKFHANGRCLFFTIIPRNDLNTPYVLKAKDLLSEKAKKAYYFSPDEENIQIEGFAYGENRGHYVISNYKIDASGENLIMEGKYIKIVYKKEKIPADGNAPNTEFPK